MIQNRQASDCCRKWWPQLCECVEFTKKKSHLKIILMGSLEKTVRNKLGNEFCVPHIAVCDDLLLTSALVLWRSAMQWDSKLLFKIDITLKGIMWPVCHLHPNARDKFAERQKITKAFEGWRCWSAATVWENSNGLLGTLLEKYLLQI